MEIRWHSAPNWTMIMPFYKKKRNTIEIFGEINKVTDKKDVNLVVAQLFN